MATADSSTPSRIKAAIISKAKDEGAEVAGDLNNTIKRWPATILAANRTERVIGRITALVSSITTIKGARGPGLPKGTK